MKGKQKILLAGLVVGAISVLLVMYGNPKNMGFCIACFYRDIAGALGMHRAAVVQYIRPEIVGLILGTFSIAVFNKEFSARGGSSPMTRFVLAALVMICALVFLGCPLRMILRIAGGDLNAIVGLAGFATGIGAGVYFLKQGFSLKRTYTLPVTEGSWIVLSAVALLALLLLPPAFIFFSEGGPGSMHAPVWMSLAAGLVVGALAQRTRLCMVGGIRDVVLFRDATLITGFAAILVAALVGNVLTNNFNIGTIGQPIAHNDALWNFLSMSGVGLGSVMLGGCPLRQTILAGEGNSDSAVAIAGYIAGAAFAHNFGLASSATALKEGVLTGGPTAYGKIAVMLSLVVMAGLALYHTQKQKQTQTV